MLRTLPPTAAPIPFRDLLSGVFSALSNNGTESNLKDQIQEYFKVKHVFQKLSQQRLGVSYSYLTALNEIIGFRKYLDNEDDFPGARFVADRILTLPTHPYLRMDDFQKITSVINETR